MSYNASADRQNIDRLLKEFSKTVRAFCEYDPLVRGSFETLRRRCGKEPCRCLEGKLHETAVFVDRSSGKRRIQKSTVAQEAALKKPVKRYQSVRSESIWLPSTGSGQGVTFLDALTSTPPAHTESQPGVH